jgi:hypothetical protein
VAVRVTLDPCVKGAEADRQVAKQLIPAGELLTVPVPVPKLLIVNDKLYVGNTENVALTVVVFARVTVHVPVPGQAAAPVTVQPVNW